MMKKLFLAAFLSAVIQTAQAGADLAGQDEIESAWLAFFNARGEASLIRGDVEHASANDIFRVIPEVNAASLNEEKQQLGFDLFHERRLSKDGSLACTSCHIDLMGGVDHRPVSFGIGGAQGTMNAPTIFNAALNFRQFWDGRALTLQEQALGPIENPVELGHDLESVVTVLASIPDYVSAFNRLYPDGITAANLSDAIAYYETMNFTGLSSPFLRQFQDEQNQLSQQARRGQQRFVEIGCAGCHNGINLGGNSFQQLGVTEPWYGVDRPASEADDGLFGRTGREQDRHVFKVPTLHNVAATGPWLHDGSITSLQQAVDWMARRQLGRYLENSDIDDIVSFLRSLGDSLSMVGDCSVPGGYGGGMTCEMSQPGANSEQAGAPQSGATAVSAAASVALPEAADLARQHQEEYRRAQDLAAAAPARITEEMQRIRTGQVAHYDFLQYEHIEMLRHVRALSYPPANLELEQREAQLKLAAQWQQSAEQYELVIADFLRNQAVTSSVKASLQDLLRLLSVNADEKTMMLLGQAEQSALAFYLQPGADTRLGFEHSMQLLQSINLNSERVQELQLLAQLLIQNVSISQV